MDRIGLEGRGNIVAFPGCSLRNFPVFDWEERLRLQAFLVLIEHGVGYLSVVRAGEYADFC